MNADPITLFHVLGGIWFFALGSAIGSFVNVCVYRIPWQKSIFWPSSHCPGCLHAIPARDNIPVLGWMLLGGRCRTCRAPIAIRYPLVELLVGLLFLAVYLTDVAGAPRMLDSMAFARMLYHDLLVALLVIATFIDFDYTVIPDSVTVPGMLLGLVIGAVVPGIRPDPATADTLWGGLGVGLLGWAVGGGLIWGVRIVFGLILRREAMGFGDVTLMALIGSFLGWQAAVLTFFLAPFFGLAHALFKAVRIVVKKLARRPIAGSDREIPFGPYLSLAAVLLVLAWPRIWSGWARGVFATMADVIGWMMGR
jgi:leader peptidase (prepilin peptidase)/N-methyltransferase